MRGYIFAPQKKGGGRNFKGQSEKPKEASESYRA